MQHQTVPQTREILAHELAAGMTVIDGTDGPLVVASVSQDTIGSLLVSFEGMPEPTLYGRLVTVDILAEQVARPGLTAATTTGRALIAAGWIYDSTTEMADDTTIRTLLHPSGREIHARTVDGDELTDLTLTGLAPDQVAGAITGAGLAPAATEQVGPAMADELRGPWVAVLADRDGFVYPTYALAAEDLFDEDEVSISVVRDTALPVEEDHDDSQDGEVLRAAGSYNAGDVIFEIDAYMVDPDDGSLGAKARYAQAKAMADGLNAAGGAR